MRSIYKTKHLYAIRLKFRYKLLTSITTMTKLVLEAKAGICSTIKGYLLLYCGKFLPFVVVII